MRKNLREEKKANRSIKSTGKIPRRGDTSSQSGGDGLIRVLVLGLVTGGYVKRILTIHYSGDCPEVHMQSRRALRDSRGGVSGRGHNVKGSFVFHGILPHNL